MFRKFYVCEVINRQNQVCGSGITGVWFWSSPKYARDELVKNIPDGYQIINFKRVK